MREPGDPNASIWRYMDLAKFIALLHYRALHFARVDHLGDPFEASITEVEQRQLVERLGSNPKWLELMTGTNRALPRDVAVSCWHLNEHESAAMWRLYLSADQGVAVRSTFARLKQVLPARTPSDRYYDERIEVGLVEYADYERGEKIIPLGNTLERCFRKRMSFEHEREVRAVVARSHDEVTWEYAIQNPTIPEGGLPIAVDVDRLIEAIYVPPTAPRWFLDVVRSLRDRYQIAAEVHQSQMNRDPIF